MSNLIGPLSFNLRLREGAGSYLTSRPGITFTGAGGVVVTVLDDPANNETDVVITGGGGGGGDMFKATYDTDLDGIVDAAESAPWSGLTGVPATFPPSAHVHPQADVTNLVTDLAAKQDDLTFKDEGVSLAAAGAGVNVDFTGAGVTASYAAGTVTVNVPGGGGGSLTITQSVVTVTSPALEWIETVAAVGVTSTQKIMPFIAAHDDTDENDAEMLDILAMSATAGTNQITFDIGFSQVTSGPIKINWVAA